MIYLTITLFVLTAILGLTILLNWLSKKEAPKGVIYSHGGIGATALVLLIVYAAQNPNNFPKASIILFVIAAVVGIYMFITDLRKKPHPIAVAFIHGLVAVSGFLTLLYFVFMK